MAKITHTHEISERREFGKTIVTQEMVVSCDYNPNDGSINDIEVDIYQDGKHLGEISKLLDKAEGSPLFSIIEAIDWTKIYMNSEESLELHQPRQ